jgi:hypothetical protein
VMQGNIVVLLVEAELGQISRYAGESGMTIPSSEYVRMS